MGALDSYPAKQASEGKDKRCVFFDRDGVVNRSPGSGYLLSPDDFILNPGIAESLRLIRAKGALAIVVTSQKCVGKGLLSHAELTEIHTKMAELLAAENVGFDAVYAHTGDGSLEDFPAKPDPAMIFAAAERFSIDLRQSWLIGDADRDIAMAQAADLAGTLRIRGDKPMTIEATHVVTMTSKLPELLQKILQF